jgi:predicted AAA+ superfamily ATPase
MFTRKLIPPKTSILLLGPRGTGKSTWIEQTFPKATFYDLLNSGEVLRLSKEPQRLFQELETKPANSWVVIDEVQKVPSLLEEVHRLIEKRKLKFVLCGSSARKLKRGGVNLLAGRARSIEMFPLVSAEVNYQIDFNQTCRYGMLPVAYTENDPQSYLRTYVESYLQEEIRAEALTRDIGGFGRFLEIAARQNGQVTNVSNISRDAQVARQTVQGYFEILEDTLLGYWLEAWKLKRSTKQVAHPKFYFFDQGIVRALSERLPYSPTPEELGTLFETFILNEVRAYLSYSGKRYPIFFWSSHDQVEVDLFLETQQGFVALEIKSSIRWDKKYNKGLHRIREEIGKKRLKTYGIYPGEREALIDEVEVLPFRVFLKRLWGGDILD